MKYRQGHKPNYSMNINGVLLKYSRICENSKKSTTRSDFISIQYCICDLYNVSDDMYCTLVHNGNGNGVSFDE